MRPLRSIPRHGSYAASPASFSAAGCWARTAPAPVISKAITIPARTAVTIDRLLAFARPAVQSACGHGGRLLEAGPMSMLRHALRDLGRRKLRHGLTAAGIAIGVAALVLLGALSEKVSRLMLGGRLFASGQISVS